MSGNGADQEAEVRRNRKRRQSAASAASAASSAPRDTGEASEDDEEGQSQKRARESHRAVPLTLDAKLTQKLAETNRYMDEELKIQRGLAPIAVYFDVCVRDKLCPHCSKELPLSMELDIVVSVGSCTKCSTAYHSRCLTRRVARGEPCAVCNDSYKALRFPSPHFQDYATLLGRRATLEKPAQTDPDALSDDESPRTR